MSASFSLVKYDEPVLAESNPTKVYAKNISLTLSASSKSSVTSSRSATDLEEILNIILPPREFEENGKLWKQNVCLQESTRQ